MKPWLAAATHRLKSLRARGSQRARTLFWASVTGLIVGLLGIGAPLEDWLRTARNTLHQHPASGEIVVVAVDGKSLQELGAWPWPRRHHAGLVDRLRALGARNIVFDVEFATVSTPENDRLFAEALARSAGEVTLAARQPSETDVNVGSGLPLAAFRRHARVASLDVTYDYKGAVWRLDKSNEIEGVRYPSLAMVLAGRESLEAGTFPIDYSVRLKSLPAVSASDILLQRRNPNLRGKSVIIGGTAPQMGDRYFLPGWGRAPGMYVHALGAETLWAGAPREFSWILPMLLALLVAMLALGAKRL